MKQEHNKTVILLETYWPNRLQPCAETWRVSRVQMTKLLLDDTILAEAVKTNIKILSILKKPSNSTKKISYSKTYSCKSEL